MKRVFLTLVLALFLIVPVVSAVSTEIRVKTLPEKDISVYILQADEVFYLIKGFYGSTNNGEVSFVYDGTEDSIKINAKLHEDKKTLLLDKYGEFDAGRAVCINLIPANSSAKYCDEIDPAPAAETPAVETASNLSAGNATATDAAVNDSQNIEEQAPETGGSALSGFSILDTLGGFSKNFYFIIAGIAGVLVIAFLVYRFGMSGFKAAPASSDPSEGVVQVSKEPVKPELLFNDADERIANLQREINRLRNEGKIKLMEQKIEEEKKEIERLRNGEQ